MREKRITKNIFLLSMFQLWTMDGEGEKMESSYFFPFQCYSLSMIFDSHFHLPSMAARGLSTTLPSSFLGLECGTEADDLRERILLVGKRRDVFLSVGAGPWSLDRPEWKGTEDAISKLRRNIGLYGTDAIGECGFDNHWGYGTKEEQKRLFVAQAELAKELEVPLIIHSRDSDQEILDVISLLDERTIMHCFSSPPEIAEKLLKRGVYLSFSGNVTYKANREIQKSAEICPLDRILYETDAPYLSPVPMRGRPNMPEYTEYTLSFLAELRNEEKEKIKESAVSNFLKVLNHSESVVERETVLLQG